MNEGTKTGLFWLVSLVMVALAAFVSMPRGSDDASQPMVNAPLFPDFSDPLAAANLKIVTYDENLGELESFEVAKDRKSGLWSIPSRQGYPADAADQMQKAATSLLDLRILDVVSVNAEDHQDFGVIEPILGKLRVGDSGVGRLVVIKSDDGGNLASLIIGNEVKGEAGKHYVRIPNQDPVYMVGLDESPLTTKFSSWIEADLLQLSSFDVAGVKIRNYSIALGGGVTDLRIVPDNSYDADLTINDSNQWELENLVVYDDSNIGTVKTLESGESLNSTELNKLKNSLDDLKIVDVVRKPEGMSANLKADKSLVENEQSFNSLITRGFYPVAGSGEGGVDIRSANGEMVVDLKNGVQYVLRFGGIAGLTESDTADSKNEADEAGGSNRYLLVTARVNQSMIPTPQPKVIPQTYEELVEMRNPAPTESEVQVNPLAPSDAAADSEVPPTDSTPVQEPGDETETPSAVDGGNAPEGSGSEAEATSESPTERDAPVAEAPAAEAPAAETPASEPPASGEGLEAPATTPDPPTGEQTESGAGADAPEAPPEVVEETGDGTVEVSGAGSASGNGQDPVQVPENTDSGAEAEGTAVEPKEEASTADPATLDPPANAEPPVNTELTEEEKQEELAAEQEKLIKENQRLRDEWQEKIDEATDKVRELNARFADWYYIIPESTYRELQLGLDTLIKSDAGNAGNNGLSPASNGPQFNFPGAPGNFGN